MASKALQEVWEGYKRYYGRKGVDDQLLSASVQAAKVALFSEKDTEYGLEITNQTKKWIDEILQRNSGGTFWQLDKFAQEHGTKYNILEQGYETYKIESPFRFDSFMYYLEKNRQYDKRFYVPRRKQLGVVVQDLQDMEDGLLDVYSLSEPSRVGKSTMIVMFLAWIGIRRPNSHNAYGGHAGQLAKRFFKGLANVIEVPEYTYSELFLFNNPQYTKALESKSSDPADFTINLGSADEFATYTARGIDGTWTGAIDVSADGYLCVDDLVRDREHSMSPTRMENTYQEYQNKMLDRLNDGAKKILIGTLWSVLDPIMREKKVNEDNPRARFRKIPALNDDGESNFQYEVKGFSTKYYVEMRERLDKAEWMAKFQQEPFVREGLTFPVEELRFFDGILPEMGYIRTIAAIDPAFGAGDSLSMPICADFGERDKYIIDWVHDKRNTDYTIPVIADKIDFHSISEVQVEKNRGGDLFAEKLQRELESRNIYHCKITLKNAPTKSKYIGMSKEEKISGYSDYIKRTFVFLRPKSRSDDLAIEYQASEQYRAALDEVTLFSAESKKQRDDAPDSLTQLAMMFEAKRIKRATVTSSWV